MCIVGLEVGVVINAILIAVIFYNTVSWTTISWSFLSQIPWMYICESKLEVLTTCSLSSLSPIMPLQDVFFHKAGVANIWWIFTFPILVDI